MRNGVDYTKKDEVIIHALSKGWGGESFVKHMDSSYGFSDVTEKIAPLGFYFAQISDAWGLKYSLFATKDQDRVAKIKELCDKVWDDIEGTKRQMYNLVLPECCSTRLEKDREAGVNPTRRLGLQAIDMIRQAYVNPLDLFERGVHEKKESKKEGEEKDSTSLTHDINRRLIEVTSKDMLADNMKNGLFAAAMNIKLSSEYPMCEPGCKNIFRSYTLGRFRAISDLKYNLKELSQNIGEYVGQVFYSHYWGEKNNSTDELGKMIKSLELPEIKKVTDLERSRVNDDVVKLKREDELVLQLANSATFDEKGVHIRGKIE